MSLRSRAVIALALATAVTAGGFAAASAARSPRVRVYSDRSGETASNHAAFLGVNLQDLSSDLKESYDYDGSGVVVASVVPGSPAEKVGIEEGDIITRFNDQSVNGAEQLTSRVRALAPGALAGVTVWRDGKRVDLGRVELGNMSDQGNNETRTLRVRRRTRAPEAPRAPRAMRAPEAPDAPEAPESPEAPYGGHGQNMAPGLKVLGNLGRGRLGVETQDLDGDLGDYFGASDGKGVLVLRVLEDTPAAKAGLKAGDVILSVDGADVADGDALRAALRKQDAGDVELRVRRKGAERTIHAALEKAESMHGLMGKGNGNWMGWMDDGNGPMIHGLHGMNGMSDMKPEDQEQLRKDLDALRKDLQEMRREMKNSR